MSFALSRPTPEFELLDPSLIDDETPPKDDEHTVRVKLPASTDEHRILRMVFITGRIGPLSLSVEGSSDVHRVRTVSSAPTDDWTPTHGEHIWDAQVAPGADELTVRWFQPYEGVQLVRLGLADTPQQLLDSKPHAELLWDAGGATTNYDEFKAAEKALKEMGRNGEPLKSAHFWMLLDLTTSLENPRVEGVEIAKDLGIPSELIAVDQVIRTDLARHLEKRWMHRAVASAGGTPFAAGAPNVTGALADSAHGVTKLVRALVDHALKTPLEDAWLPILQFACGSLRRPRVGQRLNVEPNSFAMASFAEVVDATYCAQRETASSRELTQLDLLRRMFASMLAPFSEIYAPSPASGLPRQFDWYRFSNLGSMSGSRARGRWTDTYIRNHIKRLKAMSLEEFEAYWGDLLAEALYDQLEVKRARDGRPPDPTPSPPKTAARTPRRKPKPRDGEAGAEN